MSDNLKRYCAILRHLKQLHPSEPAGNPARHLQTLAALVSGIIGSKSCQLPAIASEVPNGASPKGGKRESRSKRFTRFLQNPRVTPETFFLPYAQALVESLPPGPFVLGLYWGGDGRQRRRPGLHGADAQCLLPAGGAQASRGRSSGHCRCAGW